MIKTKSQHVSAAPKFSQDANTFKRQFMSADFIEDDENDLGSVMLAEQAAARRAHKDGSMTSENEDTDFGEDDQLDVPMRRRKRSASRYSSKKNKYALKGIGGDRSHRNDAIDRDADSSMSVGFGHEEDELEAEMNSSTHGLYEGNTETNINRHGSGTKGPVREYVPSKANQGIEEEKKMPTG